MHILFVSHEYFDDDLPSSGGIGHFIFGLSKVLVEKGHQVTVMGYSSRSLKKKVRGVQLIFFKSWLSNFQKVYNFLERILHFVGLSSWLIPFLSIDRKRLAKEVKNYIKKGKVDLIELNDYLGDGAYLTVDIPCIIRSHGSYTMLHNEAGFRMNKAFMYFERLQAKKVRKGLGVSNFSSEMLRKYFQLEDVQTMYNGLELKQYDYSRVFDFQRIFYFGTLSEAKGMDRLVTTFNTLVQKHPQLKLFIAGKVKSYFEEVMYPTFSEEAKKQVEFLGYLNKTELIQEIGNSSLVFFPSRIENFSLSLLEAMACARMAVCWDISAFREVIVDHQNGFVVKDVDQAVEVISNILTKKQELQRISDNARITIEDHFTWDKISTENIAYYKACIGENGTKINR
mgnify:CR=1 FL=1